jgi:hypothetical protein
MIHRVRLQLLSGIALEIGTWFIFHYREDLLRSAVRLYRHIILRVHLAKSAVA